MSSSSAQRLRPQVPLRDADAAVRRAADRQQRVSDGLVELERWLVDQVTHGVAGFDRLPANHIDQVAARLVDAQAPGAAALVRALRSDVGRSDWPDRILDRFGALHLLVRAHQRLDHLSPDLAASVRVHLGYSVAKADVVRSAPVLDDWTALGVREQADGYLLTRRTWLWGLHSHTWGLVLSFAAPGRSMTETVPFGDVTRAKVHRYPGSGQYRILLAPWDGDARDALGGPALLPVGESLREVQRRFAATLAGDPWVARVPVVVQGVPIPPEAGDSESDSGWRLRDGEDRSCPLGSPTESFWPLVAVSRGRPVRVVGEWNGEGLAPLSVLPVRPGGWPVGLQGPEAAMPLVRPSAHPVADELVVTALMGTARRSEGTGRTAPPTVAPISAVDELVRSEVGDDRDSAIRLLDRAARRRMRRLLALPPRDIRTDGAALDESEICPEPEAPPAPHTAVAALQRALDARELFIVGIWLEAAVQRRLVPPPELWCPLAEVAAGDRHTGPLVAAALGSQGRWFLGRHPVWRPIAESWAAASPTPLTPAFDAFPAGLPAVRRLLTEQGPWATSVLDAALREVAAAPATGTPARRLAQAVGRLLPLAAYERLRLLVDELRGASSSLTGPDALSALEAWSLIEAVVHARWTVESAFDGRAVPKRIALPDRETVHRRRQESAG